MLPQHRTSCHPFVQDTSEKTQDRLLLDVVPFSLGKSSSCPLKNILIIIIKVYEYERARGKFELPAPHCVVGVTFGIDPIGILTVSACKSLLAVDSLPSRVVSGEEIECMVQEAQEYMAADEASSGHVNAKNGLEEVCVQPPQHHDRPRDCHQRDHVIAR